MNKQILLQIGYINSLRQEIKINVHNKACHLLEDGMQLVQKEP